MPNNDYIKKLKEEKKIINTWGRLVNFRVKAIKKYAGRKILDAGCSTGIYVKYLSEHNYEAYGIDSLPDENWKGKLESHFKAGDICNLPYENNFFDTVMAFEVLEHVEDANKALKELYRVTGNNIIISVPNCFQSEAFKQSGFSFYHWSDRSHIQTFTQETLKRILEKSGFSVNIISCVNPVFPEILILSSWYIPIKLSRFIARIANKMPLRKKYYMTLLAVASKNQKV